MFLDLKLILFSEPLNNYTKNSLAYKICKRFNFLSYQRCIDQTIEWIKYILEKEDELVWTIKLKEENIIIGACGIKPSPSE